MKRDKKIAWSRISSSSLNLKGMQVAIVGGTGGIGRALSRFMSSRGATVTVVGQTFRDSDVPGIQFIKADLSLMSEAQRVARLLPAEMLDLLIFTAGIFAGPKREETPEGIERDLAVSYLNRLVMLREMAPRLGEKRPKGRIKPRVIVMAYPGAGQIGTPGDLNAEKSYKSMPQHMNTVAGNEILVLDAAKRYPQINVFGLNPGLIKTNIRSNLLGQDSLRFRLLERIIGLMTKSAEVYAEQIAPLLVTSDIEKHSGAMFDSKGQAILPSEGLTDSHIKKFIAASALLLSNTTVRLAS
ncbi:MULTISPECIES: SDR family NAD(P)-dependent oxidoreductase [Methylomonas]|uniref:Oxidoreductase n=2 Tax=Methylomonas TaxID=416 RepID=A0A140E6V2_9GAMM|nr:MULTISPECIES: SDR family NAD(P)-dependent oxidoreductase [Methylomonas]AMK79126.1 oxidoreductase [Methylomonas denitrificans]OAH99636.1 oxidoreductase [Methylomonas methanica]TCV78194.1 NAD(P)-dependent dehydrogenase (short-subunit alcohol dehydrogenase family) [Methylomonas methanica]